MRRSRWVIAALLAGVSSTLAAHDLFLKLADYRVRPNALVRVTVLNGTFTTSSNAIARTRLADLSLTGPPGRVPLDSMALRPTGTRTTITAHTGAAGTYLLGLSLKPSQITLKGAEFNNYLREEGLGEVVEARRAAGELERGATERYAKHVKMIFQAGAARSEDFGMVLGYPVELMPLRNPYEPRAGDSLPVRLLVNGVGAKGLIALAGGRSPAGGRVREQRLTADERGVVTVRLSAPGTWYVKFISMTRSNEPGIDYVSQWATLTFAVFPSTRKVE